MAMALGVATRPSSRTANEAGLNTEGLGEKIRRICGLFVFSTIQGYTHQTALEFLLEKTAVSGSHSCHIDKLEAENKMSQICVTPSLG